MSQAGIKNILKSPVILIIFGMMFFGFFCMGMGTYINGMSSDGNQVSLQNSQLCCSGKNIISHINIWKNTSLALPQRENVFLLFVAFLATLAFTFYQKVSLQEIIHKVSLYGILYNKQNPNILLFDNLRIAFAQGLLEPRIY